jgi:acyl-coenzyme A synthetase/AMP-(fatty) acid ligase
VVLDRSNPPFYRWFTGATLNTCFNTVDRHVRDGRGDQPALIHDSPVTGSGRTITYRQLLDEVARFAGLLRGLGVNAGDRVVIYMPMVPEAVVAMLACARIGAVHWWQTETGWAIAADPMGLEALAPKPGSPTVPMPGYDVHVVGLSGADVPAGGKGDIVVRLLLPPGCLPTLWGDDQRFADSYLSRYPGYYLTGDGGFFDPDGYLFVMGRTDDVINVAGHRLSTGEMEEVLASHPAVAECAVIGVADTIKGQVPRGFVVLKSGASADPGAVTAELVKLVRDQIGPVAALRQVDVVAALPKTRSGKILRKTMRGIAEGNDEPVPSTIEDPAVLDAIRPLLHGAWQARR